MESTELLSRVVRAYERGRRRLALRMALLAAVMAAISLVGSYHFMLGVPLAAILVALSGALTWRGGMVGRAVMPGLLAGAPPLAMPLLCHMCSPLDGIPACALGGVIAGLVIARSASRERGDRAAFVVTAGIIASLAGAIGCIVVGTGGILAMLVTLIVLSAPATRIFVRSQ